MTSYHSQPDALSDVQLDAYYMDGLDEDQRLPHRWDSLGLPWIPCEFEEAHPHKTLCSLSVKAVAFPPHPMQVGAQFPCATPGTSSLGCAELEAQPRHSRRSTEACCDQARPKLHL